MQIKMTDIIENYEGMSLEAISLLHCTKLLFTKQLNYNRQQTESFDYYARIMNRSISAIKLQEQEFQSQQSK
jgi:hypothetical protein